MTDSDDYMRAAAAADTRALLKIASPAEIVTGRLTSIRASKVEGALFFTIATKQGEQTLSVPFEKPPGAVRVAYLIIAGLGHSMLRACGLVEGVALANDIMSIDLRSVAGPDQTMRVEIDFMVDYQVAIRFWTMNAT